MSSSPSPESKYIIFHSCVHLHSASSCAKSRAGRVHCVVLLGKTIFVTVCPSSYTVSRFSVPTNGKSNITKYLAVACSRLAETYPWGEVIICVLFIVRKGGKLQLCGQFDLGS